MVKYLEAQGDDDKLDAFYNDHLGLPRPERKSIGKVEIWAIDRLISNYPRLGLYDRGRRWVGERIKMHNDPLFVAIAVDKQQDHLKFVIASFEASGELSVLDYGALADEDDLTFLLESFEAWGATTENEGAYRIMTGLMDCGHLRSAVVKYAFQIRGLLTGGLSPARGREDNWGKGTMWVHNDTGIPGELVQVVNFDSQFWEEELNRYRIMEARLKKPSRAHPRIYLPSDVTDDFREELANAHQVEKPTRNGKGTRPMWEKATRHPNDFADCMKMLLLIWAIHGPDSDDEPQESAPISEG